MKNTAFLCLLILFLGFSYDFSTVAVPTTRSLKSFEKDSSLHDLLAQGVVEMSNNSEEEEILFEVEGGDVQGRMDMEKNDYPGTGANNRHDPIPPGGKA